MSRGASRFRLLTIQKKQRLGRMNLEKELFFDVALIGAGTMGMAAGAFLAEKQVETILIDAFDPNAKLTCEQMAVMAVSAYKYATKTAVKVETKQHYSDLQRVSNEALEDVQKVYALGIIQGDGDKFQLKASSTRAQAAKVMSVLLQQIKNEMQE